MATLPVTLSDSDFDEQSWEDFCCSVTSDFLLEPHQTLCCGNLSQEAVTQGEPCPMCKEPNLNTVPESAYDFVEKPSEDFYCPVTFDFLLEPHQTLCCGNLLSQETVTRLQGQPCPVCTESNLNTIPDKFFKRKVTELKVRCPNKSLGCDWVGELGSLDRHLIQNSVEGECQFVTVACPYSCGDDLQRCRLEGHKANDCPNRPFTCRYCNLKATYIKISNKHWTTCEQYPVECPNKCGENAIQRQNIAKHLEEACPLTVIKCEFSYAGCEVVCQRQHMQNHLDENMKVHLSNVCCINEQQKKQIAVLTSALTRVALDVQNLSSPIFVTPPDIVMSNILRHIQKDDILYSSPFYTHIGGYKMCLGVHANGTGHGRGTHVSTLVYLMRGEYDDHLKWPFRGDITIQLLNQKRNVGHKQYTIPIVAARVVGQERTTDGWGCERLIALSELDCGVSRIELFRPGTLSHLLYPHEKLQSTASRIVASLFESSTVSRVYLKNDCLKFRVTKALVKSI